MKVIFSVFFIQLLLLLGNQSYINAQFQQHKYLNPIHGNESNVYSYKIVNGVASADSTLKTRRLFNSMGYRTLTELYKNDTLSYSYEFGYQDDTLMTYMKNLKGRNKLFVSKSVFIYDEKGRLTSQQDVLDNRMGMFFEYNKKNQKIRDITEVNGAMKTEIEYGYNKNGKVRERTQTDFKKGKIVEISTVYFDYNDENRTSSTFVLGDKDKKICISTSEFNQSGHLIKLTRFIQKKNRITGINLLMQVDQGDIHTVMTEVMDDGTPISEKEYLNNNLIGYQKYFYYHK